MRRVLILAFVCMAVISCASKTAVGSPGKALIPITGEGEAVALSRSIPAFDRLVINMDAGIRIIEGEYGLVINGSADQSGYIETTVKNKTLIIKVRDGFSLDGDEPQILLIVPRMPGKLEINGNADVVVNMPVNGRSFEVITSGAPTLSIPKVIADDVRVSASGRADIRLLGLTDHVQVYLSGEDNIDLSGLESEQASVRVTGTGICHIRASVSITGRITDIGTVYYYGNPGDTNLRSAGFGRFIRM